MLGNLLAMRYIGKKDWCSSVAFCIIMFFISLMVSNWDGTLLVNFFANMVLGFLVLKFVFELRGVQAISVLFTGLIINLVLATILLLAGVTLFF